MSFFKIINSIQRFPIGRAASELDRLEHLSVDEFLENQEKRKWEIFNYHANNNSFYREFLEGRKYTDWTSIPILQKHHIQKPLREIMTAEFLDMDVYRNNTSGSTGKPFHFAKDKFSHAMTWAYIMRQYRKLGIEYGSSLQARFFGIPLKRAKYVKEKVKDIISARVRYPIFDLSDEVLKKYLADFKKRPFQYIYGYTSSLVLFAKYIDNCGLTLRGICPTLKWCIVTSEVCSPQEKALLQKAYGVSVINEYGAAELDIIGFEDKNGKWRLNEENLFIEIVDEAGNVAKDGLEGNVVVTSLYNKAMPFIRYNLGDVVSLYPERLEKHRLIKSIQGRVNDVAILPSGKKSPGLTFYYVSKSLLEQGGFLKEFIIKQVQPDLFHFEYVAERELTEGQKKEVGKMMDIYLEPGLKASFERVHGIKREGSGKFKHFQNLIERK